MNPLHARRARRPIARLATVACAALSSACGFSAYSVNDAGGIACNAYVDSDEEVAATSVDTPFPTPAGGPLLDGTYKRTATLFHGGTAANGHAYAERFTIANQIINDVSRVDDGVWQNSTGTIQTDGTSIAISQTCPSAGTDIIDAYTARTDGLSLFVTSQQRENVYQKE